LSLSAGSLDRPHRILAGPGTGKTHTLVELYASLVEQRLAGRGEILVLTFSTSAAGEISRRLDERLRDSYDQAWISTFHSFCARLLRDHSPRPERLLLSGFQEWLTMRHTLLGMPPERLGAFAALRRHDSFVQDVLAFVALLKQNLYYPQTFAMLAETSGTDRLRALASIFAEYQAQLDRVHLADFRDLVADNVTLLERDTDLLARLRARFRYVLVDEFQDVDPAQFFLLRLLAPPQANPRLVVVGDPDQSIYGFRGTVPRLLTEEFPRRYSAVEGSLDESRRCPAPVLEAAERLLRATQGTARPARRLTSAKTEDERGAHPVITVAREDNAIDEAFFVAREIRRLVVEEGRRPGECAVLLRSTTALAAPFEEAIRAMGLPYEVRGLGALGRNEVVRFVLSYLRALASPDDGEALERVLGSGLSGVPARTIGRIRRYAIEEARPFKKVLHRVLYRLAARDAARWPLPWGEVQTGEEGSDPAFLALIGEPELDALHAALTAYHKLRLQAGRLPVSALAYAVLLETGVLGRLVGLDVDQAVRDEALADLRSTADGLRELEEVTERLTGEKPTLASIGPRLESLVAHAVDEAQPAAPRDRDAVHVMTVHQAKGLEFPFVFLSGFAHGIFPLPLHRHPLLDPDELAWLETELSGFRPSWPRDQLEQSAEEARLAYVGMTRAEEHMWITFADEYDEPAGPSAFLELAVPEGEQVSHSRSSGLVAAASVLTVSEAETVLALSAPLPPEMSARAAALGADLDFIASPASGQPFRPYSFPARDVEPDHFSATAINDYLKCPRIYWYSQHPGLASPPRSVEMERGSFLHEVLEEFHKRETEWRGLLPDDQRQWLLAELERRIHEYLARVEGTLERKAEEQEVRRILDNYIRFATSSQPIRRLGTVATEKRFFLQLDSPQIRGGPARIVGKIDRINDTGKTGRGGTAPRKYGEYFGPELHDVQLALYYLACREGVGDDGEPIALQPRWLSLWYPKEWVYGQMRQVLFAVGDPAPGVREWVQRELVPEDLDRSREVVAAAIAGIKEGQFAPAPRDVAGTCRSYFGCPHASICPFGGQPVDP
jgi:DNA helicase-2/ATP-dependent DNA helicase PcrA